MDHASLQSHRNGQTRACTICCTCVFNVTHWEYVGIGQLSGCGFAKHKYGRNHDDTGEDYFIIGHKLYYNYVQISSDSNTDSDQ